MKHNKDPFGMDARWHERPMVRPATASPNAVLPYPHYTDDYWRQARLIYGQECRTAECNYDDRLRQWDWDAAERAHKAVKDMRTAAHVEKWLSVYHGKPVHLRYIMAGCNLSSGYAYYVYGYDYAE